MIEKMKERDINNFMGKVLIELLRLKKKGKAADFQPKMFKELETLAQELDEDFYQKGRKLSQEEFWKSEVKYFQQRKTDVGSQDDEVTFVAQLINQYLKWIL